MAKNKYELTQVRTPEFRAAFAYVFKPRAAMDPTQPAKYSIVMLFPKSADLSALKKAAEAAVFAKWGDKIPKNLKNPFRDGAEKEDLDGYAGHIFITASSKMRPGVVDGQLNPISEESGAFYSGCYCKATINAFAYDVNGNRGVSFGLNNIQKTRDGEPFSGRRKAEDEFESIESDSQAEDAGNTPAAAKGLF